jgi:proton glutamate symport protein
MTSQTSGRSRLSPTTKVLVALIIGLAVGVAISRSGNTAWRAVPDYLEPIGTMWVNALRMTVIPLVVSAILLGINALPSSGSVGRLGGRVLLLFVITLGAAASIGAVAGTMAFSHLAIDPVAANALRATAQQAGGEALQSAGKIAGFGQWLVDLVPANPIKAAADGAMLPLIVFTLLIGVSITQISSDGRERLLGVVHAISEASLTLVRWVLAFAPFGVFAISVALAARLGVAAAGAVAVYVFVLSATNVLFTLMSYATTALVGGYDIRVFARAAAPAQAVAFSSRSSIAALPALLQGADLVLRLPAAIASFVLPLAVALFRCGGAIGIAVGVAFVARLYGVHLSLQQQAAVVIATVINILGAPGIPNGSILVMVPVLLAAGLPVGAVGLLLGVDTIPDMFRTVTNVTTDLAAAAILNRFGRHAAAAALTDAPAQLDLLMDLEIDESVASVMRDQMSA